MRPPRSFLAVTGALLVLGGASLLDTANTAPTPAIAARGDRLDVAERASRCALGSLMAACASADESGSTRFVRPALIQEFERPQETVLVRVELGN